MDAAVMRVRALTLLDAGSHLELYAILLLDALGEADSITVDVAGEIRPAMSKGASVCGISGGGQRVFAAAA